MSGLTHGKSYSTGTDEAPKALSFRVVKNGVVLAGATTRAEAERLAEYLEAEVVEGRKKGGAK